MKITWFEGTEYGMCCGGDYTLASNRDFYSLLADKKFLSSCGGQILIYTIDTEADGLPHGEPVSDYKIFKETELNELAEYLDEDEGDTYEAFTLDNYIVLLVNPNSHYYEGVR